MVRERSVSDVCEVFVAAFPAKRSLYAGKGEWHQN